MLTIAGFLLLIIGGAHSLLGEKYILIRLLKRDDLPKLFGNDRFTKATLRFAWHLTTLSWWGFAVILFFINQNHFSSNSKILYCISATFFLSGGLSAGFTKGRHLSWIIFWTISLLTAVAAR